ncbi:hypothetical protein H6F73_12635 [Microcoleus sp. FACHB-68]|nr:hypothetical protein [Microcoleus sp. FACHB-68]
MKTSVTSHTGFSFIGNSIANHPSQKMPPEQVNTHLSHLAFDAKNRNLKSLTH